MPQLSLLARDDLGWMALSAAVMTHHKAGHTLGCPGFLLRTVAWFEAVGITCSRVISDNRSAYRYRPWREAWTALGVTARHTWR